jgi:hypothetical protein
MPALRLTRSPAFTVQVTKPRPACARSHTADWTTHTGT